MSATSISTIKCECSRVLPLGDKQFKTFFESGTYECDSCGKSLWETLIDSLEGVESVLGFYFSMLGCILYRKKIELKSGETYVWNVEKDLKGGELLVLHLHNLETGVEPTIVHGNVPRNPLKNKEISIYGRSTIPGIKNEIHIRYVYAPKVIKDNLAIMILLEAFKFFYEKDYRHMIISAQTSVELLLYQFIEEGLIKIGAPKKKTENMLQKATTYSYQLNPLLKVISIANKFPILNEQIVQGLEEMRKDRNNLIHRGKTNTSDITKLKRELISAFLICKYLELYGKTL